MGIAWQGQDAKRGEQRRCLACGFVAADQPERCIRRRISAKFEVIYNRFLKLTVPAAAFYFLAFVCFLMSAYSGVARFGVRWGWG